MTTNRIETAATSNAAAATLDNAGISGTLAFYVIRCFIEHKAAQGAQGPDVASAARELVMSFGLTLGQASNIVRACSIEASDMAHDGGRNVAISDSYRQGVVDALTI